VAVAWAAVVAVATRKTIQQHCNFRRKAYLDWILVVAGDKPFSSVAGNQCCREMSREELTKYRESRSSASNSAEVDSSQVAIP
jgi:hypothetical protein